MDRATRFIANRKQDKIRVVREQPSVQSMREGEEVLYFRNRGTLTRYRKERGKIWTSDMHGGRNKQEEGTFTASRLEYKSSFVDYRMFSHNFTDDLPATKIYIPWQGTGEQTSVPEARSSFMAPFDMTCHKLMMKIQRWLLRLPTLCLPLRSLLMTQLHQALCARLTLPIRLLMIKTLLLIDPIGTQTRQYLPVL